jgi:hypothetical protein
MLTNRRHPAMGGGDAGIPETDPPGLVPFPAKPL